VAALQLPHKTDDLLPCIMSSCHVIASRDPVLRFVQYIQESRVFECVPVPFDQPTADDVGPVSAPKTDGKDWSETDMDLAVFPHKCRLSIPDRRRARHTPTGGAGRRYAARTVNGWRKTAHR
jgi:hypothetical protein